MLISVADAYDAIRTVRPYRPPSTADTAFTLLLISARKGNINKSFLGPLAKLTGATKAGKKVKLSNGREATILCENHQSPLMPYVRTDDGQGEELDLQSETGISITGIL